MVGLARGLELEDKIESIYWGGGENPWRRGCWSGRSEYSVKRPHARHLFHSAGLRCKITESQFTRESQNNLVTIDTGR